jgi:hypothetical protein
VTSPLQDDLLRQLQASSARTEVLRVAASEALIAYNDSSTETIALSDALRAERNRLRRIEMQEEDERARTSGSRSR